jgi:uncharacterized protein
MQQPAVAGSIVAIWRYPVKSMQGELIAHALLAERGLLGDRAYTILDRDTGYIASAKHPRKWGVLFACRAAFVHDPRPGMPLPPIRITLPDGASISSAQPDVDRILSELVGRAVSLVTQAPADAAREANRAPLDELMSRELIRHESLARAAPAGTFFDYAPVHLLTTATLERLREAYPAGQFDARRFRPNLVVAPPADQTGFVENRWIGGRLTIGAQVRMRIIDPSPRCVVTTLAQDDLARDPGILRAVSQHNAAPSVTAAPGVTLPAVAGVYGVVEQRGAIHPGDTVLLDPAAPATDV